MADEYGFEAIRSIGHNPLEQTVGKEDAAPSSKYSDVVKNVFPVHVLGNEDIVTVVGGAVRVDGLVGGAQKVLRPGDANLQITSVAVSSRTKLIGAAARALPEPVIYLYEATGDEPTSHFVANGIHIEVAALSFSSDSSRLLAVGNVVSPKVVIFDVASGLPLTGASADIPEGCFSCSFNPVNINQFCAMSTKSVYFWDMAKTFESYSLTRTAADAKHAESDAVCHAWTTESHLLVGDTLGCLACFDANTGEGVSAHQLSESDSALTALLCTKEHIIAAIEGGTLCWISAENQQLVQTVVLQGDDVALTRGASVCSMAPSADYEKFVAMTLDGTLYELPTMLDEAPNPDDNDEPILIPPEPREIEASHGSAACGIFPLHSGASSTNCFAAVSLDGTLTIFNGETYSSVNKVKLDENGAVSTAAFSAFAPIIAIGTENGFASIITINAVMGAITTLFSARAHIGTVSCMQFNHDATMLATCSIADNIVCIFDLRDSFELAAICSLNECTATPCHLQWGTKTKDPFSLYLSFSDESMRVVNCSDCENRKSASTILRPENLCATIFLETKTTCAARSGSSLIFAASGSTCPEAVPLSEDGSAGEATKLAEAHSHSIVKLCISASGDFMASGSSGGEVALWKLDGGKWKHVATKPSHMRSVSALSFSMDGTMLYSACCGGILVSHRVSGALKLSPDVEMMSASDHRDKAAKATLHPGVFAYPNAGGPIQEETCLHERYFQEENEVAAAKNAAVRDTYRKRVHALKSRLEGLLEHNERVIPLERLNRDEFVIDVEGKRLLEEESVSKANDLAEKIKSERTKHDIIASRIKKESWDRMIVKAQKLFALQSGVCVRNFPIEGNRAEDRMIRKVVNLRKLELRETRRLGFDGWDSRADEVPYNADWILNAGANLPEIDAASNEKPKLRVKRRSSSIMMSAAPTTPGGAIDDGADHEDGEEGNQHKNEELVDLIYHPLELRTSAQKQHQVYIMKAIVRKMKQKFNAEFDSAFSKKETEVEKIESKNERMKEILCELHSNEVPFTPTWDPSELPSKLIQVADDEVSCEKYLSKEERQRLRKEEEERLAREAAQSGDNMEERALFDMMNGSLEVQKAAKNIEDELVREDWMDELTPEQMTDEQKQAMEAYEATKKRIEDEKEKQRKSLELELKKLRSEVSDIVKNFDEKVDKLFDLKCRVVKNVRLQQLAQAKLLGALMEQRRTKDSIVTTEDQLKDFHKSREECQESIMAFQRRLLSATSAVEKRLGQEKAMDRGFRDAINSKLPAPLDHDTFKMLQQLYKKRGGANKKIESISGSFSRKGSVNQNSSQNLIRSSVMKKSSMYRRKSSISRSFRTMLKGAVGSFKGKGANSGVTTDSLSSALEEAQQAATSNDPFYGISPDGQSSDKAEREAYVRPLDPDEDLPNGVDIDLDAFIALQDLRTKKMEHEFVTKAKQRELQSMQKHLDSLKLQRDKFDAHIIQATESLKSIKEKIRRSNENAEIIVQLHQGQDEIMQQPVMTNYTDALLLPRTVVEKENNQIRVLGNGKIDTMTKMKDFRKSINYLTWEKQHLDATAKDVEQHYTDLHMLRMTRELNEFLQGSDPSDRHKEEAVKLEAKMGYIKRAFQARMEKTEKEESIVRRKAALLSKENASLEAKAAELRANVKVRESITRARENESEGDDVRGARMKSLVTRRKLVDLARAQTEEVEFLRSELDRLRQRTFPSFAKAKDDVLVQYPDEY